MHLEEKEIPIPAPREASGRRGHPIVVVLDEFQIGVSVIYAIGHFAAAGVQRNGIYILETLRRNRIGAVGPEAGQTVDEKARIRRPEPRGCEV